MIGRVGSMNSEYCCSFDGTIFVWFQTEKDGAEMIERISFGCRIKSAKQPTKYYFPTSILVSIFTNTHLSGAN